MKREIDNLKLDSSDLLNKSKDAIEQLYIEKKKNQNLEQQLEENRQKCVTMTIELSDMHEDEEAKTMKMDYFMSLLEEKEKDLKKMKETIEALKTKYDLNF